MDFWLKMGIDGLRLDAVPYLYEREGTNCENLPETHAFLKELRAHVDARFQDRMLLAEANQWPEDAAAYFGDGDECHMAFHFPVMPRMFMAIQMEDRFPILDIMEQTPAIPDNAQWALFLRNHDELTLEMVTDEERDYMYRVYARDMQARINLGIRRRLAPLLANNRRRIELMNGLLFSLPGTPVVYYGDEIGMGDNIYQGDRNGVRTPMQWSPDRNAGFSSASSQRLFLPVVVEAEYHYEAVNVEAQQRNHQSLLWWMKRLIALRRDHLAFGRGTLEFLHPDNRKVLVFVRHYVPPEGESAAGEEQILVVANLSRFTQYVELDLSPWHGLVPVEMFGKIEFPPIGEQPYFITLGPHNFYWFVLEPQRATIAVEPVEQGAQPAGAVVLSVSGNWDRVLHEEHAEALGAALERYLKGKAWFSDKGRQVESVEISEALPLAGGAASSHLALLEVCYVGGDTEQYLLPLAYATSEQAETLLCERAEAVVAHLHVGSKREKGLLYDATVEPAFWQQAFRLLRSRRRLRGVRGDVTGSTTRVLRSILSATGDALAPVPVILRDASASGHQSMLAEQDGQTAAVYGESLRLRLFRRMESGVSPELELQRYLTERGFDHILALAGVLEYEPAEGETATLGILEGYQPSPGDAWQYTIDNLGHYFERAIAAQDSKASPPDCPPPSAANLLSLNGSEPPSMVHEMIGAFLESVRVLGQRTAELHLALAEPVTTASLAPEPFTTHYQRSLYQAMRTLSGQTFQALHATRRQVVRSLPGDVTAEIERLLDMEGKARERFRALLGHKISAGRIRCHTHYTLKQVLFTGKDFLITAPEGDQNRPQSERRIKRSPLRDVASMLWSFHEVAFGTLSGLLLNAPLRSEDAAALAPWAHFWLLWVSAAFLEAYLASAAQASFVPPDRRDIQLLLETFQLQEAFESLQHDLDERSKWLPVSVRGTLALLEAEGD